MIQLMFIDLDKCNVHFEDMSFNEYLRKVSNEINKRLNTLRNLSIQGISMSIGSGEIKNITIMYFPSKFRKYSVNEEIPYPQIYLASLENIPDIELHINSMLTAFQNSGRYVNYVKIFNESTSMPGYCSIIHSPIAEGSYMDR